MSSADKSTATRTEREQPWLGPDLVRAPTLRDAGAIHQLVAGSGSLDLNSRYCYLLICRDFAETSLVATHGSQMLGFVSGYCPPTKPATLFVWQIGVSPSARGRGLAKRLLLELLARPTCGHVESLEATVTPSNTASRRLFRAVARHFGVECQVEPGFTREMLATDPSSEHEEEELFRIGPLASQATGNDANLNTPQRNPRRYDRRHDGNHRNARV